MPSPATRPLFDEAKRRGVSSYLAARRRELAASGMSPTLRVYASPSAGPYQSGTTPAIPTPTYQPYAPAPGQPYTYRQFSESSLPSVSSTLDPRVLQYKPGILLRPELCEELLDRTEVAIRKSWAEVRESGWRRELLPA